jgi:hypothetical protein
MRAMAVAVSLLLFVLIPNVVAGQTSIAAFAPSDAGREGPERLSLQVAAGPTLIGGGNVLSAALGYSPASRLELLLNIEQNHLPFQLNRFPDGYSATRGGTMTFVSGEVRLSLLPADRVSPFAIAGVGGGVSRPNVNAEFPDRVRNDLGVLYFGGGVRVPLRRGFNLVGDARAMLALEGYDGVLAVWPIRVGIAWRF